MISVIMPAYNEAQILSRTIKATVNTLKECGLECEVILVDDGSQDNTYEKALSLAQEHGNVRAFSYKPNMGKGQALKYGFQFAHGDLVLFLDADSDLPPSQIPRFLDYMKESNADVVIGSKRHPLSKVRYPLTRRLWSKGYSLMVKILFNLKVGDTQVGMKLFQRKVLDQVFPKVLIKSYAFDLELLANANRLGYHIVEAPVELDYQFPSRINLKDIRYIFKDTMAVFYRLKILHYYDKR